MVEFLKFENVNSDAATVKLVEVLNKVDEVKNLPSEGCSKPQSTMALSISGLRRKSLKPEEWILTYDPLTSFLATSGAPLVAWGGVSQLT